MLVNLQIFKIVSGHKKHFQVSLGLRREARKTSACLASASSAVEVRDHHHEVGLGHRIILVYNMSM